MSIPIFFEPVSVTNEKTNSEHVIVDGGMLSNFPVWLFDCPDEERRLADVRVAPRRAASETSGRRAPPGPGAVPHGLGGLFKYVKAMADTMMEAHDRLYVEKANFARTIPIPTLDRDDRVRHHRRREGGALPVRPRRRRGRSWRPGTSTATSRSPARAARRDAATSWPSRCSARARCRAGLVGPRPDLVEQDLERACRGCSCDAGGRPRRAGRRPRATRSPTRTSLS